MSKIILTITGPSGSGKSSVLRLLDEVYGVPRIITCTTRAPRKKEKDGVDYHFVSIEEYCKEANKIAPVHFAGNYYCIRESDIQEQFELSNILVVVVEPTGAKMLKDALDGRNGVCVRNIYINVPPKAALSYMARRDGWGKAKKRQKADMKAGMYLDSVESSRQYDCILANDRTASVKSIAYDIMNYVEALRFELKMQEGGEPL